LKLEKLSSESKVSFGSAKGGQPDPLNAMKTSNQFEDSNIRAELYNSATRGRDQKVVEKRLMDLIQGKRGTERIGTVKGPQGEISRPPVEQIKKLGPNEEGGVKRRKIRQNHSGNGGGNLK
jgi:hypothetical protein